jgi:hypothetical protein
LAAKGFSEAQTSENDVPAANGNLDPAQDAAARTVEQGRPRRSTPNGKFFLFGILLAELILAEPVDLDERNHVQGRWSDLSGLLWDLETVPGAFQAVKFCFDNAKDKRWINAGSRLTVGQKEQLIEDILKPIKTYYMAVRDEDPYVSESFDIADHEDNSLSFQDALG